MMAVSVGDVAMVENRKVRFRIANPAGVQKVLNRPVGSAVEQRKDERIHMVAINRFLTLFDENHTGKPSAATTWSPATSRPTSAATAATAC